MDDGNGNSINVTQTITIDDTTNPTASNPAPINVQCLASVPAPDVSVVTDEADNCGTPTVTFVSDSASPLVNDGSITRTYNVDDGNGNSINVTQTITIDDTTNPTISCPANLTIQCTASFLPANTGTATATDNCDTNVTITYTDVSTQTNNGSCTDNSYTITRTWLATDDSTNSTSCDQIITIIDTTPPVLAGIPANTTVQCHLVPVAATPTATDNCDTNVDISFSENSTKTNNGTCTDFSYSITRTWVATDNCGLTDTKSQTITVIDTTPPSITADPSDFYAECDGTGNTAALNAWLASNGGATATDNCSSVTWSNNFSSLSNTCGETGSALVTFTATDACGNSRSRTASFIIEDKTIPFITNAPQNLTVECDGAGNITDLNNWLNSNGGGSATDSCSNVTWSNNFSTLSNDCGATGSATVTFTATDDCGNPNSRTATFTIIDSTDPTASNPAPINVQCKSAIPAVDTSVVTDENDNCSMPTVSLFSESNNSGAGTTASPYIVTRIYRVTDDCGRFINVSQTITAIDDTPPTITCPLDINQNTDPGICGASLTIANPTVSDNCSSTFTYSSTRSDNEPLNAVFPVGTTTITWTATDEAGNTSASCTQTVSITDNEPPVASCKNITIALDPNSGTASISANQINNNSTDNCGIQSLTLNKTSFDCTNIGSNPVVLTVTDVNGNASTCTATVTVTDLSNNASVTINATQTEFCAQATATFTAIPTSGGSNPTYQWKINGINVPGETGVQFTSSNTLNNNDAITVEMTSNVSSCTKTVVSNPLTVTVNAERVVSFNINASASQTCEGGNITYSVNPATITNGGTNPSYQWKISTDGGATYADITGATSASYTRSNMPLTDNGNIIALEVTSNVQCADPTLNNNPITMVVNTLPTVTAPSDFSICLGNSVTLTGSGASTYTWNNGVTNGVAFYPTATQTYTVTGTDSNGCQDTDTVTVTVNPVPQVTASSNSPVCLGDLIDLTASFTASGSSTSGVTWSWTGPNGFTSGDQNPTDFTALAASAGDYTVTVTDNNGCVNMDTVTLVINPDTTISSHTNQTQSVCINNAIAPISFTITNGTGASITAGGLPPGVNGTYNSGSFNISGTPTSSGTFAYTVTATGLCAPASQSGTITVNPDATINLTTANATQTVCEGVAIGDIQYTIAGGGTGAIVTGLPSGITWGYNADVLTISGSSTVTGTHNFTVNTTGTCSQVSANGSITINPNLTPSVSIISNDADNNICSGSPVMFTATPVNGGSTPIYQWKVNGNDVGINSSNFTSSTLSDGDIVTVVLTTSETCYTSATATSNAITNNVYTPLSVQVIDGPSGVCPSGIVTYSIPENNNNILTYNWTVPFGFIIESGQGTHEITVSFTTPNEGLNTISVVTTNPCGPVTSSNTEINVQDFAAVNAGPDRYICAGTSSVTLAGAISGAVEGTVKGNNKWDWSFTQGSMSNPESKKLNGILTGLGSLPAGTVITVTISTNDNVTASCIGTETDQMNIYILGSGAITSPSNSDQTVCINGTINPIHFNINHGTGATVSGLPNGLTGNYSGGVFTISGTPTQSGTFNYTVNTNVGCSAAAKTGTITVHPNTTIDNPANKTQTICINDNIVPISFNISNGTGATVTGLPNNLSGTYNNGIFTISGQALQAGTYNYTVNTEGNCAQASQTGTITVNPDTTISGHADQSQSVCINTAITPIIFNITNGTGASITSGSLPAGVTGSYSSGAFTISGTPTVFGNFDYTVTATGACASATQSGTITVNPDATITLTTANNTQSVCENQAIAPILYTIGGGGTGATVTGLPTGINYSFNSGVLTISGDSAIAGTHNFTVNTTGTCAQTSTNGSITINLDATIDNPSNKTQTVCIDNAITPIVFTTTDATGATASGLPNGVTGNYSGGVFTISGTPTESGNFSYTVNTQGTCVQTSQTGSITVNPDTTIDDSLDKNQTVCINTSISTITFNITNGTGATVSGLPNGVTGSYSGSDFVIDGTPTEAGTFNYTVTTQGNCDQASESGTITIKEIAVISTQPQNVGVCVNTNTSLSVVAYGGITGYQWYRNGVAVSGANSNILNFSPATLANAGSYYVEIFGDSPCSNITSDTVTLNVNQLISITDQPDNLDLCEGTTATFTVTATGDTPSYQWRKDGTNILGATNASLVINNVSPADIGNYDVVITGSGTCPSITSETASLNVTQQPTASISYNQSEYCKSFAGSEPINLTGTNNFQGGNFGSSPAGLTLDSSTGAITPSTSTPGTYTVTYTMPASVCSISPVSTTVTIYPNTVAGNTLGYLDTETIADARTVLTVCHEGDGTIFASGYTGTIKEWQISTDGGLNWSTYSATSDPSITFTNLTDTTLFRAAIESGNCGIEYSLRVLLNVIPPDVKPDPVSWSASTICIGDSVTFIAQSGLGTGLGLEDGGGDFNTGQLNTQDPDSWLVDGNPSGWTANADTTKPSIDWSGSNPHVFGGILYDTGATSGAKKFGIVYGPADSDGFILETPIFNTYGLTAFEFQMDQAWNLFAGDQILIELSLDGGTTYSVTLQDITGPNSSGNHDHFGDNHFVFTEDVYGNSLISYLGQDDLRIRFTYLGTNPTSSWAIDDIQFEVDENANGIEWTDEFDEVISTENTAMVTPEFPGKHTYGVTSLINGCRSEGIDGTVFVDIDVIYAHAGPDQSIPQSNCGNNVVTLNAYDNTLNVAENFANGAYVPYDINDPESQFPGTGDIGTWSITSGPISTCGTGTFSDVNDPRATFTGEPGTYVLRWTVGNCWDEVTIVLTSCDTIDFDGINDHINFKKNYDLNNAFSIEVWIKTELNSSGIQTILSKRNGASLNGNGYDLRLVNRRISFNWNNGNSLVSNYNINTDRWYHVAVTFDGATYKLYIDGIEVGTPVGGSAPSTNNFDCILGAMDQNGQPLYYFNGWMDELRIWNKALHVEHIRQMMNQQIISSPTVAGNVQGEVLPMDIHGPDNNGFNVGVLTDNDPLLWSNLQGYYRMDNTGCGNLLPYNGIGVDGKLRNINSIQEQSAPLPYTTIPHTGYWNDTGAAGVTPWTYGSTVWDYPNSMGINNSPIDWNIVKISNNVKSANEDITLLGLIVDPSVELEILDPTQAENENNNGQGLWVTHYLKLDGWIDLIGESQLVQKRYTPNQFSESILDVNSSGYLERDQQGAVNLFNYNYWSSPVGAKNTTSNNNPAILMNNKMDGTNSSNPKPINWLASGYNASAPNPVSIPEYWLWAYENYTTNVYGKWAKLYKTSGIKAGLGYTMKGSGTKANTYQNYTFTGKPNNNTINRAISLGNEALVGNPYPSAIDAQEFIKDNIPSLNPDNSANNAANPNTTGSIDGSLYFWIHYTTNNTHVLRDYQGGYATYTLVGGVAPVSSPLTTADGFEISGAGSSNLRPGQYIPVAQGFFVYSAFANKTSNQLKFQNSQRVFKRETNDNASDGSQFLKSSNSKSAKNSSNPTVDETAIKRLRLQFKTPEGARRHLLLAFTGDNAASDGFDYGYDAKLFETLPNDMFFMINNDKCIIQGVGAFDENKQYPFGISSKKGGAIEVSITDMENLDTNTKVYIYDSLLDTYTKINDKNSKYETTLGAGDHLNRFRITFVKNQTLSVVDNEFEQFDVKYLNDSKEIQIKTSIDVDVKQVYLINILGQTLKSWNKTNLPEISNDMTIPMSNNFAEGTYIIKVVTSAGTGNKKIIIN
ncbi:LamG-like jellyroll fold domain-containing protein [Mariniflexile sp. HNIBRBA6329]|uniref:LamG-like jellyroll fold domain-containing protein n=1 Tax=Mariniflexile sp. HNIBRBA6329 TaxID=3373088 RepID=UPI003746B0D6